MPSFTEALEHWSLESTANQWWRLVTSAQPIGDRSLSCFGNDGTLAALIVSPTDHHCRC